MTETHKATSTEFSEPKPKNNPNNWLRKGSTAAGLSILSAVSFFGQRWGFIQELPDGVRPIAESMAHPALGYIGAWIGTRALPHFVERSKITVAVASAAAANFATETAQTILLDNPLHQSFLAEVNQAETFKDFAFALGGTALFMVMDRPATTRPGTDQ